MGGGGGVEGGSMLSFFDICSRLELPYDQFSSLQ